MGNLDAKLKITKPVPEYGKGLSANQAMSKFARENSAEAEYEIVKNEPLAEPKLTVVRDEPMLVKTPPYESQGLYWKPDGTFNPLLDKIDEISREETENRSELDREHIEPTVTPNAELILEATDNTSRTEVAEGSATTKELSSADKLKQAIANGEARMTARDAQEKKLNDAIARSEARKKEADEIERQEQEMIKAYDASKPRTRFSGIDERFVQSPNFRYVPKDQKKEVITPVELQTVPESAQPFAKWDHQKGQIHLEPESQTPATEVAEKIKPTANIKPDLKSRTFRLETNPEGLPKSERIAPVAKEVPPVIEKKESPKSVVEKSAPVIEPKRVMKPAEVFNRPVEAPKMPEQNLSPEERKALDGLVEFNLGKLGIIDISDPTKLGEAKQAAMEQIRLAVPNFFALSVPQQLYAIEKLAQKKSHDLDILVKKEIEKKDAENNKGGFIGRWGRKVLTKNSRTSRLRRKTIENMKQGGLVSYQQELNDVVDFTLNRGKDIQMTEKGLMIKFMDTPIEASNEHKEILKKFNLAATVLAETPYISTTKDLSPLDILQKKKFEKAQKEYDKVRAELRDFEGKGLEGEEMKSKLLKLSDADDDIRMNQSLMYSSKTNFDLKAGDKLGRAVRDYKLASKGIFAGAGWVARYGSQYAVSLGHFTSGIGQYASACGAGIVVGGALGGARGWLNKRQEFKEMADQKRYGEEAVDKKGEKAKGVKEVIDAEGYTARIEKLIIQIDSAKGEKKEALLQSLQNRAKVARERDELGLVNFGKTKNEFRNKDEFYRSLKMANATLLENDPASMDLSQKVADRIQNIYFKDELKDVEKAKEIKKAILNGVVAGATFALVGFEARDYIYHDGEMTKGALKEMSEVGKKFLGDLDQIDSYMKGAESDLIAKSNAGFTAVGKAGVDMIGGNSAMNDEVTGIKKGMPDFQKLKITTEHMPNLGGATSFEQAVGSRGIIGAIDDLQDNVRRVYGDNVPENLKSFMAEKPDRIAINWGAYRPGEDAESMSVMRGSKIDISIDGKATLTDSNGNTVHFGAEKYAGKMFDAGHTETPTTISPSADAAIPKAGFEDVSSVPSGGGPEVAGFDDSAMNGAPVAVTGMTAPTEGWPAVSAGSGGAEALAPNTFEFNTPEIKGSLVIKEDDFGRVTRVEWAPQSRIEEVRQFMATPDKFLVKDLENSGLKFPTRSYGTYELSTASKADGIKYLEMRAALKSGKFPQGSSGYNYVVGQMRLYAASIEGKSGAIFRPAHEDGILKGMKMPRVENIPSASTTAAPEAPKIVNSTVENVVVPKPDLEIAYETDIDTKGVKGHIEFFKDDSGKITSLSYEKIQSPYFRQWKNFGVPNWEAGKSALEVKKINANLKNFVGLETLIKYGNLDSKYEALLKKNVEVILKNYGEYINDEHFDEIAKAIDSKS